MGEPASDDVCDFGKGKNLKARRLVALQELLVGVLPPLAQDAADDVAAQRAWHLKSRREKNRNGQMRRGRENFIDSFRQKTGGRKLTDALLFIIF